MNITLQLPDTAYQRLLAHGGRIQGSIGLVNEHEGNFNEHRRRTTAADRPRYIRLPHGRASVQGNTVRLNLCVSLDEARIVPAQALEDESRQAAGFVDEVLDKEMES